MHNSERYIGLTLGDKYRVVRWLADGGMGSVFEAENTWTKRRVALKVLDPVDAGGPDRAKRFVREARSASRIEHPNIVSVLDMGEDKATGALYLVQELLRGRDLRAMLRETPGHKLDAEHALTIMVPIIEALEAAHQFGVIHRDVKPGNIYLAQQGVLVVPKLIDFGLSKAIRRDPLEKPTTGGGVPIGTPYYMSPEQARGDVEIDGRTDVWSIGVVLYEAITARLPFEGANATAVLLKIAEERPRPVDSVHDVPAEVAAIIHRALEPDRNRRWGSMTELLHAINDYRAPNMPISSRSSAVSGAMPAVRPISIEEPTETFDDDVRRAVASSRLPRALEQLTWQPRHTPAPSPLADRKPSRALREGRFRLGMVLVATNDAAANAVRELGKVLGKDIKIAIAKSYANLVDALAEGELDIAWLPPVAYVRALRSGAARLMLTLERDGRRSYSAAIVTRASDGPRNTTELAGRRVAWLDPWSAAGYLVPRCMLRNAGIEPDRTFVTQAFHGSYEAVLQAVREGTADVGAVYCRRGEKGQIVGAWQDDPAIRPFAVSAEPIPGDTICVSTAFSLEDARVVMDRFVEATASPAARAHFREVFNADRFVAANASRYEGLEAALAEDVGHDR